MLHGLVQAEAASGGGHDPAEALLVVKRHPADVRLKVVDLHSWKRIALVEEILLELDRALAQV